MVASIQPPAGELILGSYNYVAFLLTGVAVLSMFTVFPSSLGPAAAEAETLPCENPAMRESHAIRVRFSRGRGFFDSCNARQNLIPRATAFGWQQLLAHSMEIAFPMKKKICRHGPISTKH